MKELRKQATLMLLWKYFFRKMGIRDLRKPTTPMRGEAEPTPRTRLASSRGTVGVFTGMG